MNHRFSRIGFFVFWLVTTVLMLGLVGLTFGSEKKEKKRPVIEEVRETALQTASASTATESFELVEENGCVTVLDKNGMVYEYTDIRMGHLPTALQEEIRHGKTMSSILEVYSFLENYSS